MDFFRGWFNFKQRDNDIGPSGLPRDIENDLYNMQRQPPEEDRDLSHSWKGHGTYSSFEKEFQRMFQEFENIFRGTFSERPSIEYKFPDFNGTSEEEESSNNDSPKSLREKMLNGDKNDKLIPFNDNQDSSEYPSGDRSPPGSIFRGLFNFPFSNFSRRDDYSQSREDRDLDEDLNSGKQSLDDILQNDRVDHSRDDTFFHPFLWDGLDSGAKEGSLDFRGAFKYSTITKKHNPDGSVEIHSSRKDSDGNEETSVTRKLGGQTHTLINKTNRDGEQEIKEDFINMHQDDLQIFDEKWKEKQQPNPRSKLLVPSDLKSGKSIPDFFSSWWKPKL